jgi:thiol-disulfide isomerase/thioredoxin
MRRFLRIGAVWAIGVATLLGGCAATDPLANTAGNFTSAGGAVVEIAAANRDEPISFTASNTTDGSTISTKALRGTVTVVNFWYASCPPCRAEASILSSAAHTYAGRVSFIGVNTYDQVAVARSFEKTFMTPYPSVLDVDTASVRLAFSSAYGPNAVPTTLVLDASGRVAGRISGAITDKSILASMVDHVLAEAK